GLRRSRAGGERACAGRRAALDDGAPGRARGARPACARGRAGTLDSGHLPPAPGPRAGAGERGRCSVTPGIVKLDARAEALLTRFSAAWVHDKAVERTAKRFIWLAVACVIVAIVSIGVFRAPVIGVPAGVLLVVFAVLAFRYHRLDIEDRKLQTVMRVLKMLRADIPRDQRVALTVDLRPFTAGAREKK